MLWLLGSTRRPVVQSRPWQIRLQRNGQRALFRLLQEQDDVLRDIVEKTSKEARNIVVSLPSEGVGSVVRTAQYNQSRQALLEVASEMWIDEIPRSVTQNLSTATQMAVNTNYQLLQILGRATPSYAAILQDSMLSSARRTFQDVRSRLLNGINLSPSVFNNRALMMGKIDDIVNSGIGLGQSAREIADSVQQYINPNVMGGQRYAALRLGRTELNNAYHTTSLRSYAESPYVEGVQWKLSGSHPSGDVCNELAEEDQHDLGKGVFPSDNVPFKPHPQCFCYIVPVTPTADEFIDRLTSGEYDCGRL
jgi:hypothetical protein